jgi:hypothetical protein
MDVFPTLEIKAYEQLRKQVKSGDILLCSGNSFFSNMIKQATNSIWSHVGFILRLDVIDRILVLESVESIGVRAVPLSSYMRDYNGTGKSYPGKVMIARHQDMKQEHIANLSKKALDLLGYPYAMDQVVKIPARIGAGTLGLNHLESAPPQKEFICSEYAYVCFKSVGITIDYNPLGFISPADFARCEKVKPISYVMTEEIELTTTH